MVLLMLLILLMLYVFMQQLVKQQLLTRLQHDADSLITVLVKKDGQWIIDPTHISTVYNRVRSGHYYVVKTPGQTIRSRSLFDFTIKVPALVEGDHRSYRIEGAGDKTWLVWQQKIEKEGQPFNIWVAEDITPVQMLMLRFSLIAILLILLISILFIAIQQKILNRSFAVFDALRSNLQSIRHGEAESADLPLPVEIAPLVEEIEILVKQLRQRIQRTRNAIGNLAHEIKRPLQIVSLYIDSGNDRQAALQSFDDIQHIVDCELRRAKISGASAVGGAFDAQQEIPMLIQVMQKIYPGITYAVNIHPDIPVLELDRDDMLELLGNLIDNASKFAHQQVRLEIGLQPTGLHVRIEDDGDGVDAQHLNKITQKGYRLDETRQGHGIGLSICADIVAGYQGTLAFDRAALGGLRVDVIIPVDSEDL